MGMMGNPAMMSQILQMIQRRQAMRNMPGAGGMQGPMPQQGGGSILGTIPGAAGPTPLPMGGGPVGQGGPGGISAGGALGGAGLMGMNPALIQEMIQRRQALRN